MINLQPLYDRVVIQRIEPQEQTSGGLYIPVVSQEKNQYGKVVAVGAGKLLQSGTLQPLMVKVGDTVFFGKYAGIEFKDDHLLMREEEILAVIQGDSMK